MVIFAILFITFVGITGHLAGKFIRSITEVDDDVQITYVVAGRDVLRVADTKQNMWFRVLWGDDLMQIFYVPRPRQEVGEITIYAPGDSWSPREYAVFQADPFEWAQFVKSRKGVLE